MCRQDVKSDTSNNHNSSSTSSPQHHHHDHHHVIIVGAGMAGLACAKHLLQQQQQQQQHTICITLLEATDRIGGRIRTSRLGDLGAEFVHCQGHVLDRWIRDWRAQNNQWLSSSSSSSSSSSIADLVPWFVLSHADGGPEEAPTEQGMYGMYYCGKELLLYNDPRVQPLTEALERLLQKTYPPERSFQEALEEETELSPELKELCIAAYGNTGGCSDLTKLGIAQLLQFEDYWENNEMEGDYWEPSGMHAVVNAVYDELKPYANFRLVLNTPVQHIEELSQDGGVNVICRDGSSLRADSVVVTVPPPILPTIVKLTAEKQEALNHVGFERACKIICKFNQSFWAEKMQNLICADSEIPELWFRTMEGDNDDGSQHFTATGFLVSTRADHVAEQVSRRSKGDENDKAQVAARILIRQLVTVFQVPEAEVTDSLVDCIFYDWKDHPFVQGGYMHPKVGMTPEHLQALAEPMGNIYFAGEATNTNACCTVQAAIETGQRAARQISSSSSSSCKAMS